MKGIIQKRDLGLEIGSKIEIGMKDQQQTNKDLIKITVVIDIVEIIEDE